MLLKNIWIHYAYVHFFCPIIPLRYDKVCCGSIYWLKYTATVKHFTINHNVIHRMQ